MSRAPRSCCVIWCLLVASARGFPSDRFLKGDPFTFEQIRDAIGVIYEGRLQKAIENRGIAFVATDQVLTTFRRLGASSATLEEVRRASPQPEAGPVQRAEPSSAPAPQRLDTRERLSLELLGSAADKFAGLNAAIVLEGRILLDGPQNVSFPFRASIGADGTVTALHLYAAGPVTLAENCTLEGPQLSPVLQWIVRSACLFQPQAVLRRTQAEELRRTVDGPLLSVEREWVLHAAGDSVSYDVTFSHELLPVSVKYRSGAIPDATGEVEYRDYALVKAGAGSAISYPRRISFTLPDGAGRATMLADTLAPAAAP